MNQELTKISQQLAELSRKPANKITAENIATAQQVLASYVDLLSSLSAEEITEALMQPTLNVIHLSAKFADVMQLRRVVSLINANLAKAGVGQDAKYYLSLRDENYFTAMHYAAQNGNFEVVQFLFENGVEGSPKAAPKDREWVPIHYASKNGHFEVVKLMLQNRVDKEVKTSFGLTPLLVAAEFGHADIVQFLLQQNADKNVKTIAENFCMNALHYAAVGGFSDIVKILLKEGIDKEIKTTSGYTALHFAVSIGASEIVEMLLRGGADGKSQTNDGQDSLSLAVAKGHKNLVSLLLKWGIGDSKEALKIAKENSAREIFDEISRYEKVLKSLFKGNFPSSFLADLQSFTPQNISEAKINLGENIALNAYAIFNITQEVGLFSKRSVSLTEILDESSDTTITKAVLALKKMVLTK